MLRVVYGGNETGEGNGDCEDGGNVGD